MARSGWKCCSSGSYLRHDDALSSAYTTVSQNYQPSAQIGGSGCSRLRPRQRIGPTAGYGPALGTQNQVSLWLQALRDSRDHVGISPRLRRVGGNMTCRRSQLAWVWSSDGTCFCGHEEAAACPPPFCRSGVACAPIAALVAIDLPSPTHAPTRAVFGPCHAIESVAFWCNPAFGAQVSVAS